MNLVFAKGAAALLVSAVLFTSCKKDKDAVAGGGSTESIIGSYKLESVMVKDGGDAFDLLQSMAPCLKDDVATFGANKKYIHTDAGLKCVPAGHYESTWELKPANKIVIDGEEMTLVSTVNGKLVLREYDDVPVENQYVEITYKKQ